MKWKLVWYKKRSRLGIYMWWKENKAKEGKEKKCRGKRVNENKLKVQIKYEGV